MAEEPTTLNGYTTDKILELMQYALPGGAYKTHPTRSYLTTIDPAYTRERLTRVFGLYGYGWGLDWEPVNTLNFETQTKKGDTRYHFAITKAIFWFKFGEDRVAFPVTGHSDNDNLGDAMKGARTVCVSDAAKQLMFQLHIYKNEEYHAPPSPETSQNKEPEPQKPAPKSEPSKANDTIRPYRPERLKEILLKGADNKTKELIEMDARSATSSVVAALVARALTPEPKNGQGVDDREADISSASDKYHEFLLFVYGDRAKGEDGTVSNKNLSQADLLTLLNWISNGKASFNANLIEDAVKEVNMAWTYLSAQKAEESQ